jgi:predicted AlkP superfamily phosphohydrolase/phosphomutase/tetratricopeptide (TPR) repeat protein
VAKRTAKRVLLIGWDAADWQMIRPLIDRGWMPTLAKLIERGVSGNLATIQPMLSPMLWTSIATGKRADKHGICGFVEPRPDRTGIRPVTSTSRTCKAVWNILSQNGLKSNVISWFATHPAEPIDGAIVSDRYATLSTIRPENRRPLPGTFHPARLSGPLMDLVVDPSQIDGQSLLAFVPRAAEIDQDQDDRLVKLAALIARTSTVHAAACRLLREEPWDFTAVYYGGIDQFGHSFMPYHPPRIEGVTQRDAELYGEVMSGCYRFHDMMLEALIAYAGRETTVLLVSDHGFLSGRQRPGADAWERPEHWHRPFGIACAAGPAIKEGESLYGATLLDVTPTILALFGLPVAGDMDGRPWLEISEAPTRARRLATWESVAGAAGMHSAELREDPIASAEAIRQLVELGYIEPPDQDVEKTIRKTERDLKVNLALAVSNSGRARGAIPLWEQLLEQQPEEPALIVQLALSLLRVGCTADARRALDRLRAADRNSPFVLLMEARIALDQGDSTTALDRVGKAVERAADEPSILNRAGEILIRAENWDQAEETFRRSLALLEDNPVALDGLAQVHLQRDQPQAAVENALRAVGLTHFFPAAHFHLGEALRRAGRGWEAIAAFQTCLNMGYQPREVHRRLARVYRNDPTAREPPA